eukprot:5990538-Ditylum_brightwellii.AAC.1
MARSFSSNNRRGKCEDYYDSHESCSGSERDGYNIEARIFRFATELDDAKRLLCRNRLLATLKQAYESDATTTSCNGASIFRKNSSSDHIIELHTPEAWLFSTNVQ